LLDVNRVYDGLQRLATAAWLSRVDSPPPRGDVIIEFSHRSWTLRRADLDLDDRND
jgi:hypothetical protein